MSSQGAFIIYRFIRLVGLLLGNDLLLGNEIRKAAEEDGAGDGRACPPEDGEDVVQPICVGT